MSAQQIFCESGRAGEVDQTTQGWAFWLVLEGIFRRQSARWLLTTEIVVQSPAPQLQRTFLAVQSTFRPPGLSWVSSPCTTKFGANNCPAFVALRSAGFGVTPLAVRLLSLSPLADDAGLARSLDKFEVTETKAAKSSGLELKAVPGGS